MAEELGFRTPAKEIEGLRKRVEEIEGITTYVADTLILSLVLYLEIFTDKVISNPKDARKIKDGLLSRAKSAKISPWIIDILDDALRAFCDEADKYLQEKSRGA